MSDYSKPSCSYSARNTTTNKPNHVKRLNFGQSVLNLDVVEHCDFTLNRSLVIDKNVAHIPCTRKKDYVRTWIETHKDSVDHLNDDLSQISPVLGTITTETSKKSPILGNKQRCRREIYVNKNTEECMTIAKNASNVNCQENTEHSANICITHTPSRLTCGSKEESENDEQNHAHSSQYTPPYTKKAIADVSPILGTDSSLHKKRQRQSHHRLKIYDSRKRLKQDDSKTENAVTKQITKIDNDSVRETFADKSLENLVNINSEPIETRESIRKLQMHTKPSSSLIPARLNFKNNSDNNDSKINSMIEIDTSDESMDEKFNKFSNANSSIDNNLSNLIEEVNTQDSRSSAEIPQLSVPILPLFISKQSSKHLRLTDSDETYCSEAEVTQNQSVQLSAQISQALSLKQEGQAGNSTQTDGIISSITTPSKMSPDKVIYTQLLDSGKKRHKPKKGSIAAKLQSLINAQISGIRIWRYRMNKEHDTSRFITVFVRSCLKRFGNQFLNGTLIEDRYNLLQNEIKESASHSDQVQSKISLRKDITIMLVCDIVGTLKMKSEVVINVYPPWNILDKTNLTLDATYISLVHNYQISDSIKGEENKSRKRVKRIIKEFNCPCIEEERELPFCARKPNSDKPDVIQKIFES